MRGNEQGQVEIYVWYAGKLIETLGVSFLFLDNHTDSLSFLMVNHSITKSHGIKR